MLKNRQWRWIIAILVAMAIWCFVDVRRRAHYEPRSPEDHRTDLTVYTEAGRAFFEGGKPYEVANPRGWTYLYPPLFALPLAPLARLAPQNQATVWFFVSLLFCFGGWRECRRLVEIVCDEDSRVAAAWARWSPWLATAAVAAATLPMLNCLQRGQVSVLKLYFLLLGVRLILDGRTWRAWLAGGCVLAVPVLKIVPALQVGFLIFFQFADFLASRRRGTARLAVAGTAAPQSDSRRWLGRRFAASTLGVAIGLSLVFLFLPAMLLGWQANLRHLNTWGSFMLTKADDGGMDPRSGNSHSARNQSLHNAAYRLGNFGVHLAGLGADDRAVETWSAPPMAMDSPAAQRLLLFAQATLVLALLAMGVRLARGDGNRLDFAVGFALASMAMLVVAPVARGHYFVFLAPAVLFVPLWLARGGRPRAGAALAAILPALSVLHYVLLPYAGRVGLLGLGAAAWLMAALVLIARIDWTERRAASQAGSRPTTPAAAPRAAAA